MSSFGISDKGLVRAKNQDCFCLLEQGNFVFGVVCDGIGGNKAGEVASEFACDVMKNEFTNHFDGENKKQFLLKSMKSANERVYRASVTNPNYLGMGTTLVGFIADANYATIINVGDSRCYALKEDKLVQLTTDHTLLNDLVQYQGYDYQTASSLVGKNVISKAVGIFEEVAGDVFEVDEYRALLLCSDGLHGFVSEKAIAKVLNSKLTVQKKCEKLVEMANNAGGYDNVTVVIYQR